MALSRREGYDFAEARKNLYATRLPEHVPTPDEQEDRELNAIADSRQGQPEIEVDLDAL
ncbi:MAG: hypothetical protein ACOY8P_10985 [Thermodesulfobacteriota bacterium]